MDDDCERLDNIKELLRTVQASLQRKSLVLTYLQRVSYTEFVRLLLFTMTAVAKQSRLPF